MRISDWSSDVCSSDLWSIHRDVLPKAEWPMRVQELLRCVGLKAEQAWRYPHQFSGGQRQRIAIARAIALTPEVIVCDAAVSALDVSIQAQVIETMKGMRRRFGFSGRLHAYVQPGVR